MRAALLYLRCLLLSRSARVSWECLPNSDASYTSRSLKPSAERHGIRHSVSLYMTQRGVWQLQRLTVNYCEQSGSSQGAREFLQHFLPSFTKDNQQLAVATQIQPGRHPYLRGEYRNGSVRQVSVRNDPMEEILRQAVMLRSSIGRKAKLVVKQRHIQKTPSIQRPAQQSKQ